jgi:hypothetical protein
MRDSTVKARILRAGKEATFTVKLPLIAATKKIKIN